MARPPDLNPQNGKSRSPILLAILVEFYKYKYHVAGRRGGAPNIKDIRLAIGNVNKRVALGHVLALIRRGDIYPIKDTGQRKYRLTEQGLARARKRVRLLERREKEAKARERDKAEKALARSALLLRAEGRSYSSIALQLGVGYGVVRGCIKRAIAANSAATPDPPQSAESDAAP